MKRMKRVISIALSIMMLVSTVNFTAFAESTDANTVSFPTTTQEEFDAYSESTLMVVNKTKERALIHSNGEKLNSEADTVLALLGAEKWNLTSVIKRNSDGNKGASALTFLHPADRDVVDAYYKYVANVTAIPESAEFYYTRHINTTIDGSKEAIKNEFMEIIYGISPTTTTELSNGQKHVTTLYLVGFNIAQNANNDYVLLTRLLTKTVTECVYNDGTENSVTVEVTNDNSGRTVYTFSQLGLSDTDETNPNNSLYDDSIIDITKLLKVRMTYNDSKSATQLTPSFSLAGKFTVTDAEQNTSEPKQFNLAFSTSKTVEEGTKKAVGIYAGDNIPLWHTAGAFANPVVSYTVTCSECTYDNDCDTECNYCGTVRNESAHNIVKKEATEPTGSTAGNIEYWYCNAENGCGKYYSDAEGTVEIEDKTSVIIPATGWNVVAYSMSTDNQFGIAEVSGGATAVVDGTNITLTAATKPGYSFKGWYQATVEEEACTGYTGEVLSKELSYTFAVTADGNYVAVYEANGKVSLTVNGYGVKLNDRAQLSSNVVTSYRAGSQVKVAYEGADFKYWKNGSGKIVSKDATYTFTLVNATELILVTAGTGADAAFVEFVSSYNQVLYANTWYADDNASDYELPVGPSKVGYNFTGWTMDGREMIDVADIINVISTDEDSHIIVSPLYAKSSEIQNAVTVTVYNGAEQINPVATETKTQGSTYKVTAEEVENSTFSYWVDGNGTILSYNTTYTVLVSKDITIKAVYDAVDVDIQPVVAITGVTPTTVDNTNKVTIVATRSIPSGYTFVQAGMLYDNAGHLNVEELVATLVLDGSNVSKLVSTSTSANGAYVAHIIDGDSNVYARAYIMVMNNATGNIETYYSSPRSTSFETLSN